MDSAHAHRHSLKSSLIKILNSMKISFFNFKGILHCFGKDADRPERRDSKLASATDNPLDVLTVKVRNTGEKATAQRIRSHFIALAEKSMKSAGAGDAEATNIVQAARGDASWAGKNEEVAKEALKMVRLALYKKKYGSYKSTNKFRTTDPYQELRRVTSGEFCTFKKFEDIGSPRVRSAMLSRSIWQSTSVNCDGLALSALDFISRTHPNVQVSSVSVPGHTLALVGTIDITCINSPFSEWPSHLYVCDPWANIACPAPEYPQRFAQKMEKWESEHKQIFSGGEWLSPTNEKWVSCAKEVPTIFTRFTYKDHQFVDLTYVTASVESPTTKAESATANNSREITPSANR
jgi:hypothetical protein